MTNDITRLARDLETVITTIAPDTDISRMNLRLQETLVNYEIQRKTQDTLLNDTVSKIDMFLSDLKLQGYSEATINSYYYILHCFTGFVDKHVSQITHVDIKSYLSHCSETNKVTTLNTKLITIKSFFNWLVNEDMLLKNPALKVKSMRTEFEMGSIITPMEMQMIKHNCTSLRILTLVTTLHSTGCRISELLNAKITDINFNKKIIRVKGKGNKYRDAFLNDAAVFILRRYLESRNDDCEYVFVSYRKPYRKLNSTTARDEFNKVLNKCNIDKKITFHSFRRTTGTELYSRGLDVYSVAKLLGHSPTNMSSIKHYVEVNGDQLRVEYDRHFGN